MNENLTEKNFLLFCASHYDNPQYYNTEDFMEDLNRIKYIKKLITRYVEKGELKERLILNHIIVLNNSTNIKIFDYNKDIYTNLPIISDHLPVADRKSTRLNSSHIPLSRMPSSA